MASIAECSAVVLCGGASSRFGSDKALARFRGATLLGHLVGELRRVGFAQVVLAGKEQERVRAALASDSTARGLTADPGLASDSGRTDWLGFATDRAALLTPLAGLAVGLRASEHEWVFACAVDMPFAADRALLEALLAASAGEAAVAPVHAGVIQPLCALWNRARCVDEADAMLRAGSAGPRALLQRVGARSIDWPEERPFLDADTPEALAALASMPII